MNTKFWKGKRVLITGHTGFKGSWLSILLHHYGAKVAGYSLDIPTNPSLFKLSLLENKINHYTGEITDIVQLKKIFDEFQPEIIIHMAAKPIVQNSYKEPIETYTTNVMGTIVLFEALRSIKTARVVINVTTDKVYENNEWVWGYRENDQLGGYDPYSTSKACSELITASYQKSFFPTEKYGIHGVAIATVRSGNVIGGGDWGRHRLLPDIFRMIERNKRIIIRNPSSIRPWLHVLDSLNGYLMLAEMLYVNGPEYSGAWNFGPNITEIKNVQWVTEEVIRKWGKSALITMDKENYQHEANNLILECSKARMLLNWSPKWNLQQAIEKTVDWMKKYQKQNPYDLCVQQIEDFHNIEED